MRRTLKLFTVCAMLAVAACNSSPAEDQSMHQAAHGAQADPATDKITWLSQLMLIRGHVHSGAALYVAGDAEGGAVHMKHPEDELYADLQPAFAAWGATGFADELRALAASVEGKEAQEKVKADLVAVQKAIDAAADAANPTPKELLLASAATLRTAAEEFDLAVKDGKIVNAREYQDAHGFMTTALTWLDRVEAPDEVTKAARSQVEAALSVAPDVVPPAEVTTKAETISDAAQKIEELARRPE